MRSIERRYKGIIEKNPNISSYIGFYRAIKDGRFSRKKITIWFKELVDEDDYDKTEKHNLLDILEETSQKKLKCKTDEKDRSHKSL